MTPYALTVFLSAFLLFQVQPLIAKIILPWFGGGPAVWNTCLLFFECALLAGYGYAHLLSTRLRPRWQAATHLAVLMAAVLALPITPDPRWRLGASGEPVWRIIALLSSCVGLPYFALAATSPLLQAWRARDKGAGSPYRLYALSNAASLTALVSFPFLVEPSLSSRSQALVWSLGFVVFGAASAYCAIRQNTKPSARASADGPRPGAWTRLLWLLLAADASTLLLAVTNQMCLDVAVVPFLWVAPLSLYLLSFVVCFDADRWYRRVVFLPLLAAGVGLILRAMARGAEASLLTQTLSYCAALFAACMVCHGELARLRPAPRHLTSFYLTVAAGGALGGVFVAVVAPLVFSRYLELPIGVWLCCALALAALARERRTVGPRWTLAAAVALAALAAALRRAPAWSSGKEVAVSRDFYGVLTVLEYWKEDPGKHCYVLMHGRIPHGWQYTAPDRKRVPTTYYGEPSGIGIALKALRRSSGLRVGVIGLGTGTLAAYARPGDRYRFYEIDPGVKALALRWFTYLADCAAPWEIVLGDARLSLEREPPQAFDVLALDAFSGDAIPVHLLTAEAFETYLRHLKPGGVVALHITNRHLDLGPVVAGLSARFHLRAAQILSGDDDRGNLDPARWVLLSSDGRLLNDPTITAAASPLTDKPPILWTDDFSDLFSVLSW